MPSDLSSRIETIAEEIISERFQLEKFNDLLNSIFEFQKNFGDSNDLRILNLILNNILQSIENSDYVYLYDLIHYSLKDFIAGINYRIAGV